MGARATTLLIDPLSVSAVGRYGDVLGSQRTGTGQWINAGTTLKITAQAPELTQADGQPSLHIYRTRAQALPLALNLLECHRLGSQTFVPLGNASFVVVVALSVPGEDEPDLTSLKAFWVDGCHAVTLSAGTWHHPLIALEDGDFVVLERAAPEVDCLIHPLTPAITLQARAL